MSRIQSHLNLYKGQKNPFSLPINISLKWMRLDYTYKEENVGFSDSLAAPGLKEVILVLIPVMGPQDK